MNNRLLIAAFVSICFLSGSCKISSGQGSRYDFSSLDSVIQGWVDKILPRSIHLCSEE